MRGGDHLSLNLTLADGASYVMDHQRYESYITTRMLEKYFVMLQKVLL